MRSMGHQLFGCHDCNVCKDPNRLRDSRCLIQPSCRQKRFLCNFKLMTHSRPWHSIIQGKNSQSPWISSIPCCFWSVCWWLAIAQRRKRRSNGQSFKSFFSRSRKRLSQSQNYTQGSFIFRVAELIELCLDDSCWILSSTIPPFRQRKCAVLKTPNQHTLQRLPRRPPSFFLAGFSQDFVPASLESLWFIL